jgi:hypothetical protein
MTSKSLHWGKILLSLGLLAIVANGLVDLLISRQIILVVDPVNKELRLGTQAYLKITERLNILNDLMNNIGILQDSSSGDLTLTTRRLKGNFLPLSELGARLLPEFFLKVEVRRARKERVNVERKMEHLEIILASIERRFKLDPAARELETVPSDLNDITPLARLKMLRRNLLIDQMTLQNLSVKLNNVKIPGNI